MLFDTFFFFRWVDLLDILIVSVILHRLFLLLRGTTALQVMLGLLLLWLLEAFAGAAGLVLTSWLLRGVGIVAVVAMVVVFRNELRELFQRSNPIRFFFGQLSKSPEMDIDSIVQTAFKLAETRTGAIIVLQGMDSLRAHLREGSDLDGKVNPAVIKGLFAKQSPVHDGAIVIQGNLITRVGTFLPLTQREGLPAKYGTRHRAAFGLSEVSDAAMIVVSEERGEVSLVQNSRIQVMKDVQQMKAAVEQAVTRSAVKADPGSRQSWASYVSGLLLTCLLVATVWGLYTGGEQSLISMGVPIDFRNLPEELELKEVSTESVEVQVSGRQQLVNSLSAEQVRAFLDLRVAQPGVHTMVLNQENIEIPSGLEVMRVSPTTIRLELEERVRKAVPIEPRIVGQAPEGYRYEIFEVNPESVSIIGPKSELSRLNRLVIEDVELGDADPEEEEITVEVPLVLSAGSLRLVAGEPRRVQLRIRFYPEEAAGEEVAEQTSYHVVRSGETLWGLSRRYGLTIEELRRLNELGVDKPIQPGQKLRVGPPQR
jgi:uncharacterized protein (TIGR00159 family)